MFGPVDALLSVASVVTSCNGRTSRAVFVVDAMSSPTPVSFFRDGELFRRGVLVLHFQFQGFYKLYKLYIDDCGWGTLSPVFQSLSSDNALALHR